jgi:hypothetical protein
MYVCTAGKEKSNGGIKDEREDLRGTFTGVLFFTHAMDNSGQMLDDAPFYYQRDTS